MPTTEEKVILREFVSGAVRSTDADKTRYDLITPIGLDALARYYADTNINIIPANEHLGCALQSCYVFLGGDTREINLVHALFSVAEAIAVRDGEDRKWINVTPYVDVENEGLPYERIPFAFFRAVAGTCHEGSFKYSDYNWEKGMPVHDLLNHAIKHIQDHLAGKDVEPDLDHAAWNLLSAIHSLKLWPHLNDHTLRGPGCTPPTPKPPLMESTISGKECVVTLADGIKLHGTDWTFTPEAPEKPPGDPLGGTAGTDGASLRPDYAKLIADMQDALTKRTNEKIWKDIRDSVGRSMFVEEEPKSFRPRYDLPFPIFPTSSMGVFGGPILWDEPSKPARVPFRIPAVDDFLQGGKTAPRLYISGPMTGKENHNFAAFKSATDALRLRGFIVRNPAEFGANPSESWADCLRRDIVDMMLNTDIVVRLPGWEESRGASLEVEIANRLGMGVVDLDELLAAMKVA